MGIAAIAGAGCGGSGSAGKVSRVALVEWSAKSASCHAARAVVAAGKNAELYRCYLRGAHIPLAEQLAGSFGSPIQLRCYLWADGRAIDISSHPPAGC